ncbi:MAG: dienelactone hydrolase family protein [Chloroflexota bacterium]
MQQEEITLTIAGGESQAYVAAPDDGGPGVLVLHSWWGLNPFFKSLCDRLAEDGFIALAPDLYQGPVAETEDEAQELMEAGDDEAMQQIVRAAADALLARTDRVGADLGVIGFSLGAAWAVHLATQTSAPIGAVVIYYGAVTGEFNQTQAPFLAHFGEQDEWEPPEYVQAMEEALRDAGRDVTVHMYPEAGHWFVESDHPDTFYPEAADLAWQRTIAFLQERLER